MFRLRTIGTAATFALVLAGTSACSDGSSSSSSVGGAAGSAGSPASGGTSSGGSANGTGGTTNTGGATASGGATNTGGTTPAGGAAPSSCDGGTWTIADIPAPGSSGVVYVSDLTPSKVEVWGGAAQPGTDESVTGKALVINDVCYPKGLGVHTFSRVSYALGGAYKTFVADTGLDFLENSASMIFEVNLDGQLVYDKGQATLEKTQVAPVELDVTGKNTIELYVRDAFDDSSDDFGVWGGARLLE